MSESIPEFGHDAPADTAPSFDPTPAPDAPDSGISQAEAPAAAENTAQPGQSVGEAGVEWTGLPSDAPAPDYALPQRGEDSAE